MWSDKSRKRRFNMFEMKCFRSMVGVTKWDRITNEEIRRSEWIEETLAEKVDRRVMRWFGHVQKIDVGRWQRKVQTAKVEGQQGKGRPRFSWLDGVKRV